MSMVYKYCDHYGVDILKNLELKITPPNQFNDPFEFVPHVICSDPNSKARSAIEPQDNSFLKARHREETASGIFSGSFQQYQDEILASLAARMPSTMEELQKFYPYLASSLLGVLCLSKERNSIVMWSHYCDKHRGLVIGFDGSHPIFQKGKGLRPVIPVKECVAFDSSWKEGGMEGEAFKDALVFSKNEEWAYEGELRQIFKLDDGLIKRPIEDKITGKKFLGYFHPVPPEAIVSVSLGVHCPQELEQQVELALQHSRLSHVKLDRAKLHKSKFELAFE